MPNLDLTETQFLGLALLMLVVATIAALIIITMRAEPQYVEEDEIPKGPRVKRWPVDYDTEHL